MPASKQRLDLPQVPDPRDRALLEHGVADRPRRVVLAQPPQVALVVELGGEDVGPEAGDALVEAGPRLRHQLEHGAVELHDLGAGAAQHEPGGARAAVQRCPPRTTRHEPVIRRCEWIVSPPSKRRNRCLPWASTSLHRAARQALRPAVAPEARVRGRELVGHVALQHRPDAARGVVDRVALGHRPPAYGGLQFRWLTVDQRRNAQSPPPPVAARQVQPALAGADRRARAACSRTVLESQIEQPGARQRRADRARHRAGRCRAAARHARPPDADVAAAAVAARHRAAAVRPRAPSGSSA